MVSKSSWIHRAGRHSPAAPSTAFGRAPTPPDSSQGRRGTCRTSCRSRWSCGETPSHSFLSGLPPGQCRHPPATSGSSSADEPPKHLSWFWTLPKNRFNTAWCLGANKDRLISSVGKFRCCLVPPPLALAVSWALTRGGREGAAPHGRVFFGRWPRNEAHFFRHALWTARLLHPGSGLPVSMIFNLPNPADRPVSPRSSGGMDTRTAPSFKT